MSRFLEMRPQSELKKNMKVCKQCKSEYDRDSDTISVNGKSKGIYGNLLISIKEFCSVECSEIFKRNIEKENYFKSRLPKRFINSSLDNYICKNDNQEVAVSKIKSLPIDFTDNILIYGETGCGKTHLATAIFKKSLIDSREYLIKNSTDIMIELRSTFSTENNSNESDVIQKYINVDVLIVDDIGTEKNSDYVTQSWYQIINQRYNDMKPTVFTTNMTLPKISEFFGDRIASRMASGMVIKIEGNDERLNKNTSRQ